MTPFVVGHATHPQAGGALALVVAQLQAQLEAQAAAGQPEPTLGFVYFTDAYAGAAASLLAALRQRWPQVAFVGTVGIGVAASGVEYFDEPGLVVMLAALPRHAFRVFSGASGWPAVANPEAAGAADAADAADATAAPATALVHADPATPDLAELLGELAGRTASGYLFGGVAASRSRSLQIADGVFEGGLSGVAFGAGVHVVSRVTQGCAPIGPARRVTQCDGTVVLQLDGDPALLRLFNDIGRADLAYSGEPLTPADLRELVPLLRRTLVGLTEPAEVSPGPLANPKRPDRGSFGEEVRVRHLIGIDPAREAVAVAEQLEPGMELTFCQRDPAAARRDLIRMCTEVREEVESGAEAARAAALQGARGGRAAQEEAQGAPRVPRPHAAAEPAVPAIRGALYFSCSGRGGPHFGGPSAELQLVRHALGDVPLAGFFAAGEIAHRQLYGYTGVLTVFCA